MGKPSIELIEAVLDGGEKLKRFLEREHGHHDVVLGAPAPNSNPQSLEQVSARDSWETDQKVFDWASERWGPFELDAAASHENYKCAYYYTKDEDALAKGWRSSVAPNREEGFSPQQQPIKTKIFDKVWLNPPYSDPYPWLAKAKAESEKGATVVVLVNADHTTKWYKDFVYDYEKQQLHPNVQRVDYPKRIKFKAPAGLISKKTGKPVKQTTNPFPSMFVIFTPPEQKQ